MMELKVAAKAVVMLSFGGSNGWPLQEFVVDAEKLQALHEGWKSLRQESDAARIENTILREKIESMKCGPHCCATIVQLKAELAALKKARLLVEQTKIDELFKLLKDFHDAVPGLAMWQPIETAPNDGTPVLVYHINSGKAIAVYRHEAKEWSIFGGGQPNPTHWMPLPESPR